MLWSRYLFILLTLFLLSWSGTAHATTLDGNKYGLGFQWADPVIAGVGLTVDLRDRPVTLEPVLGLNDFPSAAFRLRYAFARKRFLEAYGYGMIGVRGGDKTSPFGGAGVGVDWDWRTLENDLPPVSWSFEIGYNKDRLSFGFGAFYTFKTFGK